MGRVSFTVKGKKGLSDFLSGKLEQPKAKKRDNPEERLHFEVAALLRKVGLLFYHGANEGDLPVQYRVKLKKKGTSPGFPDLFIAEPVQLYAVPRVFKPLGLFIELKNGKAGRVSPAQQAWIDALNDRGYRAVVCRDMDEVLAVLRECYPDKFP